MPPKNKTKNFMTILGGIEIKNWAKIDWSTTFIHNFEHVFVFICTVCCAII